MRVWSRSCGLLLGFGVFGMMMRAIAVVVVVVIIRMGQLRRRVRSEWGQWA
jgi:uncharacterized membrane protein